MAASPITAPQLEPGKLGLLGVAEEITDPGVRWDAGVAFLAETCDIPTPLPLALCVPADETQYDVGENGVATVWYPFLTIGRDPCAFLFPQGEDRRSRVRRHLEATESHQAEQEFMYLTASAGTTEENPGLFSAEGYLDLGTAAPVDIIADVDAELYERLAGQEGIVHIAPRAAARAVGSGLLKMNTDDGFYRTHLGNRVAIGSGYAEGTALYNAAGTAGSTAINDSSVVFGTPMVYFTRGDLAYQGFDNSQSSYRENIRNVWAERPILVWTSRCAVVGGRMTVA